MLDRRHGPSFNAPVLLADSAFKMRSLIWNPLRDAAMFRHGRRATAELSLTRHLLALYTCRPSDRRTGHQRSSRKLAGILPPMPGGDSLQPAPQHLHEFKHPKNS
ncbi:hypothetical protein SAMN05216604_1234 [Pseudomonas agarici]|nr:hypothetical protein SAMN05216604_1234 [Pseudomonas agarici]